MTAEKNEIKDGYDKISKEVQKFTNDQIAFYEGQGSSVDRASHTEYCHKIFVLGKLQVLTDRLDQLANKGKPSVKKSRKKTKRKSASKKTKRRAPRQLDA